MKTSFLKFAVVAVLLAVGFAHAELVDKVAAVVNNDVIALSEVEARAAPELMRLPAEPAKRLEAKKEILKQSLDALIGDKLLDAQIKELNMTATDEHVEAAIAEIKKQNNVDDAQFERALAQEHYTLASYKVFLKKHLAKMNLVNLKIRNKIKVTDDDLKSAYAREAKTESMEVEIRPRHILVQVKGDAPAAEVEKALKKARALADEARTPGVDFAALAKKKSEGASKDDGGDLGYFRRGVMEPDFEKVVFKMKVGDISDPIRTNLGWHVVKLEDRKNLQAQPFEEMKEALRQKIMKQQEEKFVNQYIQDLRSNANVVVKL